MEKATDKTGTHPGNSTGGKTRFPSALIIVKWIFGLAEIGGGVYIMIMFHNMLGILYAVYAAVAGALILPLSSCVSCYYYGKSCHCGWGRIASLLYDKNANNNFKSNFVYRIFCYPVWAVPFLASLMNLARGRNLLWLIIFASFTLIVIINHRLLMKYPACKPCLQRFDCPGCQYYKFV